LNTPLFQISVDHLQEIHELFSRHFPEGALEKFKTDQFMTDSAINLATRYFTSRRDDPYSPSIPFSPMIDPKGVLSSMQTDVYFHGEDNAVVYYALKSHEPPACPRYVIICMQI
jgi:hypothetical protein